jgi:1-acyl-sn-glycerol-3-phosphate acyltransferase
VPRNWAYTVVRGVLRLAGLAYFRMEATGHDNIPAKGGALLVSNHASNLDPPLVATNARRHMHFLAKEELFESRIFGGLCRKLQAHPINRGGVDRRALRECLDILSAGEILVVFPEGTRTPDGTLQEAKPGVAMIAAQAQVPVVPVYIEGSFGAMPRGVSFPRPRKVRVHYGRPFDAADAMRGEGKRERYEALTAEMMRRIAELAPRRG